MNSAIGNYKRSAEHYERHVKRYPAEPDSWTALTSAIRLRIALNDHRAARANFALMTKLYARKQPAQVAQVGLALVPGYRARDNDRGLIKYLRRYLRRFASADRELHLLARSELAEALWRRSCTSPTPAGAPVGACLQRRALKRQPKRTRPTRCGPRDVTLWRPADTSIQARQSRACELSQGHPAGLGAHSRATERARPHGPRRGSIRPVPSGHGRVRTRPGRRVSQAPRPERPE